MLWKLLGWQQSTVKYDKVKHDEWIVMSVKYDMKASGWQELTSKYDMEN
jgi:hypothetical protein